MTDYTDLKARLRAYLPDPRWWNSAETNGLPAVLRDALAAIEELEQRISMGGSSDAGSASDGLRVAEADSRKVEPATSVEHATLARSGEPPAQPIDGAGPVPALHQGSARSPDPATVAKGGAIPSAVAQSSAAPAPEPVAWKLEVGALSLLIEALAFADAKARLSPNLRSRIRAFLARHGGKEE